MTWSGAKTGWAWLAAATTSLNVDPGGATAWVTCSSIGDPGAPASGLQRPGVDRRPVDVVVERRRARDGEDLPRSRVHRDGGADLAPRPGLRAHGRGEAGVQLPLQAQVDREPQVGAGHGVLPLAERDRHARAGRRTGTAARRSRAAPRRTAARARRGRRSRPAAGRASAARPRAWPRPTKPSTGPSSAPCGYARRGSRRPRTRRRSAAAVTASPTPRGTSATGSDSVVPAAAPSCARRSARGRPVSSASRSTSAGPGAQQRGDHEHPVHAGADVRGVHGERHVVPVGDRAAGRGQPEAAGHLLLPDDLEGLALGGLQPPAVDPEGDQQHRERRARPAGPAAAAGCASAAAPTAACGRRPGGRPGRPRSRPGARRAPCRRS